VTLIRRGMNHVKNAGPAKNTVSVKRKPDYRLMEAAPGLRHVGPPASQLEQRRDRCHIEYTKIPGQRTTS